MDFQVSTQDQLAKRWGISLSLVRKLIRENRINVLRFGRSIRIAEHEIRAIEERGGVLVEKASV